MSLVLGADFSYLAPRARLIPAYAGIGMSGDGGITWLLPRLCGLRKATELLMLNKPITPAEAVSLGLATEALPEQDEAFQEAVLARARQIAAGPRQAFSVIQALLRASPTNSFEQQLTLEASGMARLAGGPELPEGLQAMSEKRKPVFS
jgi:2-(1,2-epoxy-1,2-dihydrophenyl)acetyl-CoA isomerase